MLKFCLNLFFKIGADVFMLTLSLTYTYRKLESNIKILFYQL
ncbi:MAG: hypothetical protein CH6_1321 [Candidatus Kapaibacterium sp.]|nr:MAG: hypothetical protein CH6_1321 [Candidatus Kapabacteria bacterium]